MKLTEENAQKFCNMDSETLHAFTISESHSRPQWQVAKNKPSLPSCGKAMRISMYSASRALNVPNIDLLEHIPRKDAILSLVNLPR